MQHTTSVGDVRRFPSGRHFASYLGLTLREHSSGGPASIGRNKQARRPLSPHALDARGAGHPLTQSAPDEAHALPRLGAHRRSAPRVEHRDRRGREPFGADGVAGVAR